MPTDDEPRFCIPMPNGRVARVPVAVLEQYAEAGAACAHGDAGDSDLAVSAHHMSIDATTGSHEWHTDWELGECQYTDEAGFVQHKHAWHRHPFGTEYAELYEGR